MRKSHIGSIYQLWTNKEVQKKKKVHFRDVCYTYNFPLPTHFLDKTVQVRELLL